MNGDSIVRAVQNGHVDVVQYLCQIKNDDRTYRCDPSDENNQAIREAANNGRLDVVKYLCELKNDDGMCRCDPSDDLLLQKLQEKVTWIL